MLNVWEDAFPESGYGDEAEARPMSRLTLPKEVDWKGDHESLEAFLEAIEHACPLSHFINCGTKKANDCGLCHLMRSQDVLDHWLYLRKTKDPEHANRYYEKEGNWS